jgi:hypothetical protein
MKDLKKTVIASNSGSLSIGFNASAASVVACFGHTTHDMLINPTPFKPSLLISEKQQAKVSMSLCLKHCITKAFRGTKVKLH